jgi:hypothetical protein
MAYSQPEHKECGSKTSIYQQRYDIPDNPAFHQYHRDDDDANEYRQHHPMPSLGTAHRTGIDTDEQCGDPIGDEHRKYGSRYPYDGDDRILWILEQRQFDESQKL